MQWRDEARRYHKQYQSYRGRQRDLKRKEGHTEVINTLWSYLFPGKTDGQTLSEASPQVAIRILFRRFWRYVRPYWWLMALLVVLGVVSPLISALSLGIFGLLINQVLVPRDLAPLGHLILFIVLITIAQNVVGFTSSFISTWLNSRFVLDLRLDFYRHLQTLSLDFFNDEQLGDILSRLNEDTGAIQSLLISAVISIFSLVAQIVFYAIALLVLDWQMAIAIIVVAPVFFLTANQFAKWLRRLAMARRRQSASILSIAEESLANSMLVQAYNRQDYEAERFQTAALANFRLGLAGTLLDGIYGPINEVVELVATLIIVVFGSYQVAHGTISLGSLVIFMGFVVSLYGPVQSFSGLNDSVATATVGAERLLAYLDREPAVRERPDTEPVPAGDGTIAFRNVSFAYPNTDQIALRGVTFTAKPGQTVAIVGRSGSGKSTLVKLLLRFYDPESGGILLNGRDLRALSLASLRDHISVVLQETMIFDGTVRDNIAYGRPGATDEEIIAAAEAAGAHDFIMNLPQGYATPVGQRGRKLSGGQRQRIAIARAMVRNAPILILDEPTTGLDAETAQQILEPLRRLMAGRTTFLVTHNLNIIREADLILLVGDGRVVAQGTHEELMRINPAYARLYQMQDAPMPYPVAPGMRPPMRMGSPLRNMPLPVHMMPPRPTAPGDEGPGELQTTTSTMTPEVLATPPELVESHAAAPRASTTEDDAPDEQDARDSVAADELEAPIAIYVAPVIAAMPVYADRHPHGNHARRHGRRDSRQ